MSWRKKGRTNGKAPKTPAPEQDAEPGEIPRLVKAMEEREAGTAAEAAILEEAEDIETFTTRKGRRKHASNVRLVFRGLRKNLGTFVLFEVAYKGISLLALAPMLLGLFQLLLYVRGYDYLTVDNLMRFLLHPVTGVALIVVLVLLAFVSMMDVAGIIYLFHESVRRRSVSLKSVFRSAFRTARRVLYPHNWLILPYVLFLLPLQGAGVLSTYISSGSVEEFLEHVLHPGLLAAMGVGLLLCLFVALRWMYSMHFFVLEHCSFWQAAGKSWKLTRGHFFRDVFGALLLQLVVVALFALLAVLGVVAIVLVSRLVAETSLVYMIALSVCIIYLSVLTGVLLLLALPLYFCSVGVLFYRRGQLDEAIRFDQEQTEPYTMREKRVGRGAAVGLLTCAVVLCTLCVYGVFTGSLPFHLQTLKPMEVTAHRGSSVDYPENTMLAFRKAVESGADWIELDVQQTADRQIFVMHDSSLRRTTGLDKNAWTVTWNEVKTLDAGSWFGRQFAGEPVPLLAQVIDFAKEENVQLNIELKPTGHETDFEKEVCDLILDREFEDRCVLTSQVYDSLEKVKAYTDKIPTAYVMSVAAGSVTKLSAADVFSVNAPFITNKLVSRVHGAGKEILAWTVNSDQSIQEMIDLNVDNVITDNVIKAKELIATAGSSDLLSEYVGWLIRVTA